MNRHVTTRFEVKLAGYTFDGSDARAKKRNYFPNNPTIMIVTVVRGEKKKLVSSGDYFFFYID